MVRQASFDSLANGSGELTIDAAKAAYTGKDQRLWAFSSRGNIPISFEEFEDFYHCVAATIPGDETFERELANDWVLPNSKLVGKYGEIVQVRVTHSDGRVTTESMEWDVTMEDDMNLARTYLLAKGISARKVQRL